VIGPAAVRLSGTGGWTRTVHAEEVWGTVVTFEVRGDHPTDDAHLTSALGSAASWLHDVDGWFSTYRVDSTITAVRNGLLTESQAPAIVRDVLAACRLARRFTQGVFDPWAVPGGVDPSGYVKGWAAGVAADLVVRAGYPNVLVNAAGDIACRGEQAPGEPWAVGILDPGDTRAVIEVVRVRDGAVATSGLYERGAHIIDPRSGRRQVALDSATVVGPDPGLTDALATAVLLRGPESVAWFAALPAYSIYLVRDRQASWWGPAFAHKQEN
jgi:thiamine biosynthesis lipoprotein